MTHQTDLCVSGFVRGATRLVSLRARDDAPLDVRVR